MPSTTTQTEESAPPASGAVPPEESSAALAPSEPPADEPAGPAFRLEGPDGDGVAVVVFDRPRRKVNTLSLALLAEFEALIARLRSDAAIRAVVLVSGKEAGFVAGADIDDLDTVTTAEDGARLSRDGHRILGSVEDLGKPTVAALHGDCLGGGLELALAATARVAAEGDTKLGLPEVMLGLLPGAGGTVRLPRLIGLDEALPLILQGGTVRADKALRLGLVDAVVPKGQLRARAVALAKDLAAGTAKRPKPKKALPAQAAALFVNTNPVGRRFALNKARTMVMKQTKGLYPAPLAILDVLEAGTYEAEAEAFGRLLVTKESAGLRHLFRCITAKKKDDGPGTEGVQGQEIRRVGMLGAGLMGGGIATVLADKGYTVRLKDISWDGVRAGLRYADGVFGKKVRKRHLTREGMAERTNRLSGGLDWAGFGHAELVIEAVPEVLDLKRRMVAEVEATTKVAGIFASNTSSLPIAAIAHGAAHPERVVGMHFFSPVEKMPLVEVIVTERTDPAVTKAVVGVARRMGKHVIVVNDCAGFYTTRVLAPYLVEATFLLLEGHDPLDIDDAAMSVGFPVGPVTLMDEVGIDVGAKVLLVMEEHYGARMQFPDGGMTKRFVEEGRLGKKASRGFYRYEGGKSVQEGGRKVVDPAVRAALPEGVVPKAADPVAIAERLVLALVNEAAWCRHDGVLRDAMSGDLGAVFGIGFPPMEGGPFAYVDRLGAAEVVARLNALQSRLGRRFAPCPLLVAMAEAGERFHG